MRDQNDYGPEDFESYEPPETDKPVLTGGYEDDDANHGFNDQDEIDNQVDSILAEEQDRRERKREEEEYARIIDDKDRRDKTIAAVIFTPIGIYFIFKFLSLIF